MGGLEALHNPRFLLPNRSLVLTAGRASYKGDGKSAQKQVLLWFVIPPLLCLLMIYKHTVKFALTLDCLICFSQAFLCLVLAADNQD